MEKKLKPKRPRNETLRIGVGYEEDSDGDKSLVNEFRKVSKDSVRRFMGTSHITMDFDGATRNLLDYLTETMSDGNYIRNSKENRGEFNRYIKRYSNHSYTDNTIKMAFSKLIASGILIKVEKGLLRVHPKYFFRGTERERIEILKGIFLDEFKKSRIEEHSPKQRKIRIDLTKNI